MRNFLLVLLFISSSFFSLLNAQSVIRGPYLQKASSSSMTIKWRTNVATQSKIEYGTDLNNLDQSYVDLTERTEHEVTLLSLDPETVYYYQVATIFDTLVNASDDLYFKTHPVIGTEGDYRLWVLGDCGTANNNQRAVRDAYYNYTGSEHTDGILLLGDNAYNSGTDNEYQDAIFENMYEDKLKNTVTWSTLGNHDGYTANSNSQTGPYYDIFSFPTAGESGGVASGTEAYYSFDYGNIHFISLESYETDRSVGGAMYNWLENDLLNTTQDWIVAFWHHPPYSKGSHNSDSESYLIDMRENFLPLLEENGVDLVLSGHSHSYERSYFLNGHYGNSNSFDPSIHTIGLSGSGDGRVDGNGAYNKDANGENAGLGAVYITAGSSGKISGGSLNHNAMFYSVSRLGSCVIEVSGAQMDVKFIRENGNIDDYFTINKNTINCSAGDPCDDGDPNTTDDTYDENCICIGSIVDAEFCEKVSSGNDDVEQSSNFGYLNFTSSDLELVVDSTNGNADVQRVGLRFNNINIPQGATISEAYIQFTAESADSAQVNLLIQGVDVDNLNPFSSNSYTLSNLPKTTASVPWNPPAWYIAGESGINQRTSDIVSITNEIMNRPGFTPNNSIGFVISGIGRRIAESYNGNPSRAAQLCIVYSLEICPTIGQSCDDGDPCTINDVYNGDCNCEGTYSDMDYDGVCDANDLCAGAEPGTPCSDGDPCTINDVIDSNCNCVGTYTDSDNDTVCDAVDFCPNFNNNLIGTPCDDGNVCTEDDTWTTNCDCVGIYKDSDNDGTCDALDLCFGPEPGIACNDGDPCTINDVITSDCNCAGTFQDSDNDGVCNANDQCPNFDDNLIGTSCDDGNACTINDVITSDCNCVGTFQDSDNDGVCDANDQCPEGPEPGQSCNDGDACTINDTVDNNCNCVGVYSDSDNDGVCDPNDQCPNFDDNLIGTSCDDGNACTINDIYNNNCNCEGTLQDSDNDGVCDMDDQCPGEPDPGQACDDGDSCTINDVIDSNCNCVGTFQDSDNDGICDINDSCPNLDNSLIGTSCDDGDPNTSNDVYTNNCTCAGINTSVTVCSKVSSSNHDAEENINNGSMNLTSSDLELIYDGKNQLVGMKFTNLNIPQGATITNAHIQFTTDETFAGYSNLTIRGEDKDNPSNFNNGNSNISNRATTSASQSWNALNWSIVGERGNRQRTPDISNIITEIVSRPGFSESSPIVIIFSGSGKRVAESYDGSSSNAPELCITYVACPQEGESCEDGDPCTSGETYDQDCNCTGGVNNCNYSKVFARVMLQGLYDASTSGMHNLLKQQDLIPSAQPYNTAPWNYNGSESSSDIPYSHSDWVLLVVRDGEGNIVGQSAGFVDVNGFIFDADGSFGISVNSPVGNYISIHHRSHLAVISSSTYVSGVYDFTTSESQVQGIGQMILIDGKYMLLAGDYDGTGVINSEDFNDWKIQGAVINQYLPIDGDGNGIVNSLDYNLWILNRSKVGHPFIRY